MSKGTRIPREFENSKRKLRLCALELLESRSMLAADLDLQHTKRTEPSASSFAAAAPRYAPFDATIGLKSAVQYQGDVAQFVPMIAVGNPNGVPPVSIASRTDPNISSSPFAGVVSLSISSSSGSFICSGALLTPTHVVTAAHCLDIDDNGSVDVSPNQVTVFFNDNNPGSNSSGATGIVASALVNHPSYTGFLAPSLNDDIAVVTLSVPAPSGVPIYPIHTAPFTQATQLVLADMGLAATRLVARYQTVPTSLLS